MSLRRSMEQLRPARTQKIDLQEKSQILLQEGNTQAAFDMEQVILSAAGGPFFKSDLIPNSKKVIGIGSSKKNAQQNAAAKLLKILDI